MRTFSKPLILWPYIVGALSVGSLGAAGCSKSDASSPSAPSGNAEATPPALAAKTDSPPARVAPTGKAKTVQLFVQDATASSFLKNNWNRFAENYHPNYLFDDNPKTAWVEGADGNGEGEWVRFPLTALSHADQVTLKIKNGYQKSKGLLKANAALSSVEVTAFHRGLEVARKSFALKRTMGQQSVSLPLPVEHGVDEIRLRIEKTINGSKYKDTCISDVDVFVTTRAPYKKTLEARKRQRLLKWAKDRRAEAVAFKNLPRTYPYAATTFTNETFPQKEKPCPQCDVAGLVGILDGATQALAKRALALRGGRTETMAKKRSGTLIPDGMWILEAFSEASTMERYAPGRLVQLQDVAFFETKQKSLPLRGIDREMMDDYPRGAPKFKTPVVHRNSDGKIEAIVLEGLTYEEGRESETDVNEKVTLFYENERLTGVVKTAVATSLVAPEPEYDENGPVGKAPKPYTETQYRVRVIGLEWNADKTKIVAATDVHTTRNSAQTTPNAMFWSGRFTPAT